MIFEYIQSLLIIIAAIMIFISAIGLLTLKNDMKKVGFVRIHIVGLFDIACIIAFIGLGAYLLAFIYVILAPFTAYAIGRSYFKEKSKIPKEESLDNPFIHPVSDLRKDVSNTNKESGNFSISKIDILEE